MRRPTLFLTVGLPGTGKTTDARRIEVEKKALRLTKDEWLKALYGLANPPSASDVIEGRLIEIGLRALESASTLSSITACGVETSAPLYGRRQPTSVRRQRCAISNSRRPSSAEDLTGARQNSRTQRGTCLTRNSPSGLPSSASQRQEN